MNSLSIESKIRALATADDLPQRLSAALSTPAQTFSRRPSMSPDLGYGRHAGPAPHTARPASVILLLFQRNGSWHLPLTERPLNLSRHAGQISLPGGAVDPGETSSQAALRELNEELGTGAPVEILGQLADCYVFASDFVVSPWVAATSVVPQWQPNGREVQRVVELGIDVLLDESNIGHLTVERGPLIFHAPCHRVGTARVWGATSIILNDLADALRQLLEND